MTNEARLDGPAAAAEERQRCAADVAFELGMTGEPTFQEVLEFLRLAYRDRCRALAADLNRPGIRSNQGTTP